MVWKSECRLQAAVPAIIGGAVFLYSAGAAGNMNSGEDLYG